ncbi:MAG: ArsR family transcriptional regulator [Thermoplasmata archaeon]
MTEIETRDRIYRYVTRHPGTHLRQIQRELNISLGTLRHHLASLEDEGLLESRKERRFRRFFASGKVDARLKPYLGPLRQDRLRRVVLCLLTGGPMRYTDLLQDLMIPESTLALYLRILMDARIIKRRKQGADSVYEVRNEDAIRDVLRILRRAVLDELADRALEIFEESSRR